MAVSKETIDYIDHTAVVRSVNTGRGTVTVELTESAGCSGCAAASICNPKGKKIETLEVAVSRPESYREGEKVLLRGTAMMHRKAITVATVIPSIALIVVMVAIYVLTADQAAAALGGLGSMVFFFVMLWLFRDRLAKEFTFQLIPFEK